jgi:hypothetical protein
MSDQPPSYAPPPPEGYGAAGPSRGDKPASVNTAVNLIWANIALSVLSTVLTFVYLDSIVEQASGGAVTEDAARSAAIVGAFIGLLIGAGLYLLLGIFIGKGRNWARIVYTILGALGIIFGLIGLVSGGTPVLMLVLSLVSVALTAAAIFLLWKPESSAWFSAS